MATSVPIQPNGRQAPATASRLFRQLTDIAGHRPRAALRDRLRAMGQDAVPALAEGLSHDDPYVRFEAINLLGELAIPRTLPLMLGFALDEYESRARWRAFWAVTRLPENLTVPRLLEALTSRVWQVRWHAALMLSILNRAEASDTIADALGAGDQVTRLEALGAARSLALTDLAEPVSRFLDNTQPVSTRQEAAMALGRMRGPEALTGLARALVDPAPGVRWRAAMALGAFGKNAAGLLEKQLSREANRRVVRKIEQTLKRLAEA